MELRERKVIQGIGVFYTGLLCIATASSKRNRGAAVVSGVFCCLLYFTMP